MIITAVYCLVTFVYVAVILTIYMAWKKADRPGSNLGTSSVTSPTFVSVIIPFRNEGKHLPRLFQSLNAQSFAPDRFEVVLVNDHSNDLGYQLAEGLMKASPLNVQLLQMPEHLQGKKAALAYGIDESGGTLIVTTDADCTMGGQWLQEMVNAYESHRPKLLAGPVTVHFKHRLIERVQALDLFSLIGITGGMFQLDRPVMCNGANLCFEKIAYYEVGGYSGVDQFDSGDDVFLMLKIKKRWPGQLRFISSPEAMVSTSALLNWKSIWSQRIRWASKSKYYRDADLIALSLLALCINLSIIVGIPLVLSGYLLPQVWLSAWVGKMIIDYLFLRMLLKKYHCDPLSSFIIPLGLIYPFYTALIAILAPFVNVEWKGRPLKN